MGTAVTSTPWSFPNLCNPLHKHLGAMHFEQSSVPCWWRYQQSHLVSIKWLKCLNLNSACVSKSQKICEAISVACLHLSHLGLSATCSLNRYFFQWECPVSNPVIILDFGVTLEYSMWNTYIIFVLHVLNFVFFYLFHILWSLSPNFWIHGMYRVIHKSVKYVWKLADATVESRQ